MDTRFERILGKVKGFRLNFSEKPSLNKGDGEDGEFRINKKQNKSDLYVKMDKKWNQISQAVGSIEDSKLSANGYVKFGNGFIVQWGSDTRADDDEYDITFPINFPNECFSVVINRQDGGTKQYAVNAINFTKTKFSINRHDTIDDDITINYVAIGN